MINSFKCAAVGGNTGIGECSLILSKIAGVFLVRPDFRLAVADLVSDAAVLAALSAAAVADLPINRIYPVHEFVDITDNTTDPQQQTTGYGFIVNNDDGVYNWTFPYFKGGICLSNQLRKFNAGQDVVPIFYDSNGTLFGWRVGNELAGIPLIQYWANKWRPNTGAAALQTNLQFIFQPQYINEQLGFYKLSQGSFASIKGLQNVALIQSGAQAAPSFKFKALMGCDGVDLYDEYQDDLADQTLWLAYNAETGAAITVTSVVKDANIKGWTVLLSNADADYTAATNIRIVLAAPSLLAAAGIEGVEGVPLTFSKA